MANAISLRFPPIHKWKPKPRAGWCYCWSRTIQQRGQTFPSWGCAEEDKGKAARGRTSGKYYTPSSPCILGFALWSVIVSSTFLIGTLINTFLPVQFQFRASGSRHQWGKVEEGGCQISWPHFCSTNACLTSGKSATPIFKNLTKLKLSLCKTSETQPLKQSQNYLTLPNLTTPKNLYFAYPQSLVPTRQTLHPYLGTWVTSTTEFLPFIICIYLEEMYIINIIMLSLDFEDTQNFFAKQKINGIM